MEFDLTIEQLWELFKEQQGICALSGRQIAFTGCKSGTASLDRKSSSGGYTIDNVWWVHTDINYAKQSLSAFDFIQLCKDVATHNRESNES